MRNEKDGNTKSGDAVRNLRPLDELFERWSEGVSGAREVLARAARRSGENARDARESLWAKNGSERDVSGSEVRGSVFPFGSALWLAASVAEEARSQSFLGAWAALAAGERLSRAFGRPFIPGRLAPSPRRLAL